MTRETFEKDHKNWQYETQDTFERGEKRMGVPKTDPTSKASANVAIRSAGLTPESQMRGKPADPTRPQKVDLGKVFGGADLSSPVGSSQTPEIRMRIAEMAKDLGIEGSGSGRLETQEKLTQSQRDALPDSAFADPKRRRFPMHDPSHARNALARMKHAGPKVKEKIVNKAERKGVDVSEDVKERVE